MEEGEKIDDGTRTVTKVHGRQGLDLNWGKRSSHEDVKVSGGLECGSRLNCHIQGSLQKIQPEI